MDTLNRRYFIGAAAGAAISRPVRAAQDQVRVGIIGTGGRGSALLRLAAATPKTRLTHLCDIDQNRLEQAQQLAFKQGASNVRTSTDMRKLLEDREVDAVIVATPDHWHAPATILACDAGKDVYVEKPVSHNLREGRLMVDAARRNKRIVQAGLQSRSRPNTMRAVEIAKSGKLGKLVMAKAWNIQKRKDIGQEKPAPVPPGVDYDTWVGPAEMAPYKPNRFHYNWHWDWNFGTGDMGNDGAHQIDIARWALDESVPKRVSGMGGKYFFKDDQQTPDTMNITFDYGDKALIWEMRIWSPYMMENFDNGVALYGTDAMILIGDWNRKWGYRIIAPDYKMIEESQEGGDDFHMRNFIDCVISRDKPNCEIEIGHLTTVHCHLGNIVSRVGRNVAYNAANESIPNDPEAHALTRRKYRNHWATPKGV